MLWLGGLPSASAGGPEAANSEAANSGGTFDPPHVILIVADDLGYGDLGCYGQQQIKTPCIDALAENGLRFTDFYAGSTVCAPSRCCLMTGYHTGHAYIRGNDRLSLRDEDYTVAEIMLEAGYYNGIFGKWGLGEEGTLGMPTRQGFLEFYGYLNQRHAHNYYPSFLFEQEDRVLTANVVPDEGEFGEGVASEKYDYSHSLIVDRSMEFIRDNYSDPFFLYLPLTIPHANNEAGRDGMEVPDFGQYADKDWNDSQKGHAAMISLMDRDVGRIVDLLDELGIRDNTIIFFTSDNGPHSEGGVDPAFNDSNGPLRGSKRSLHEGGIRVPLIANCPGKIPAGVSRHVAAFWDFMPTLAAIGDVPSLVPSDCDGISFHHELFGEKHLQARHPFLCWTFYEKNKGWGVRRGKYKLICQPYDSDPRLYDLERDLGEIRDVANVYPDTAESLRQIMIDQYKPTKRYLMPGLLSSDFQID